MRLYTFANEFLQEIILSLQVLKLGSTNALLPKNYQCFVELTSTIFILFAMAWTALLEILPKDFDDIKKSISWKIIYPLRGDEK